MILRVYSIFDRKAEVFNAPMCFVNDDILRRALTQIIPNDADMQRFPEDFDVYFIGTFDNGSGYVGLREGDTPGIVLRLTDLFGEKPPVEQGGYKARHEETFNGRG